MKTLLRGAGLLLLALFLWLGWVLWVPVSLPNSSYQLTVGANRTMGHVASSLAEKGIIRNRLVLVALARISGLDRKVKAGAYRFHGSASMWEIYQRLASGRPDETGLTIVEGWTFKRFRQEVARNADIEHSTQGWSDEKIMAALGQSGVNPEGLFFPSTYLFAPGSSDLAVYRQAFATMQKHLEEAWEARQSDLPYSTPYELLIMASLIEKETAHPEDRGMVASVFINRLRTGMRLQTDPAVIYGMGSLYRGRIGKAGLQRDTPYNTYTRGGLTPTPIALPGRAALDAAANPAQSTALYFVAKGGGRSQFSDNLEQHNQAVRQYILKRGP